MVDLTSERRVCLPVFDVRPDQKGTGKLFHRAPWPLLVDQYSVNKHLQVWPVESYCHIVPGLRPHHLCRRRDRQHTFLRLLISFLPIRHSVRRIDTPSVRQLFTRAVQRPTERFFYVPAGQQGRVPLAIGIAQSDQ